MYVRQTAWLNAIPETPKRKNLSALESEPVPRRKKIEANGGEIVMPPVEIGAYLIDHLWDVGPVGSSGMGASTLTYAELSAWQRCAGIELQPWELRIFRLLSADYVMESKQAEKPECPPPFNAPTVEFDRAIVAKQVGDALKAFARAKRR